MKMNLLNFKKQMVLRRGFVRTIIGILIIIGLIKGIFVFQEYRLHSAISKIPPYPEASIVNEYSRVLPGDDRGMTISREYRVPLNSNDTSISTFYFEYLNNNGWKIVSEFGSSDFHIKARKGDSELRINIGYKEGSIPGKDYLKIKSDPSLWNETNMKKIISIYYLL